MATPEKIKIELLPKEQELLFEYGYPFEPEERQLKRLIARGRSGTLSISSFYLGQLIGNLSHSVNKRTTGSLQDRLAELCDRLEYIQATGDGMLDLL